MRRSGRPWDVVPSGAPRRPDARGVVACFPLTERTTPAGSRHGGVEQPHPAAGSQLRSAQARLAECDALQDEAVETLARALVADGQPRGNPFEAFGAPAPGTLTRLAFAE